MKPLVDVEFRLRPRFFFTNRPQEFALQVRKCRTDDSGNPVWTEWKDVPVLDDAVEVR